MDEGLKQPKDRALFDFWDRLCSIPRYAFLLSKGGNSVQKAEGLGNWIDRDEATAVVGDAQEEINVLRQDCATMIAELEDLRAQAIQGGEAVATIQKNGFSPEDAARLVRLPAGTKLYTHPADQVAEGVVVRRDLLANFIEYSGVHKDGVPELWQALKDELRQLLAKNEGGKA